MNKKQKIELERMFQFSFEYHGLTATAEKRALRDIYVDAEMIAKELSKLGKKITSDKVKEWVKNFH